MKWKSLLILLLLNAAVTPATESSLWAGEAIDQEEPTSTSVGEIIVPIEKSFIEKPVQPGVFQGLKELMKDASPFIRDTKLRLNLRTFYYYQDKDSESLSEAWTLGGSLSYRSGWLFDRFSLGTVLYTSQPLYAPNSRGGTDLLEPVQEGYTVLGQIYGRIRLFDNHFFNLYRYEYNTPYINRDDSRMTPKTFEGYAFQGEAEGGDDIWRLRYIGGYITKIKDRNSDRFVWMSEEAGADVQRGVAFGGGVFSCNRFSIGAVDYFSNDIMNIFYAETKFTLHLSKHLDVLLSAQFTGQQSVGDDLLTGDSFATTQTGFQSVIGYKGLIVTLGYTRNAKGADLQHPWSSYPGYTSSMITFFNHAGENAFLGKVSYDFTRIGLNDIAAYLLFVHGWGRVNPSTNYAVPDSNEFDADLQWRPKEGFLKGLWLRTRYGISHQYEGSGEYIHNVRMIVNYDFTIL